MKFKPKAPSSGEHLVAVKLNDEIYAQVTSAADSIGATRSGFVRQAIIFALDNMDTDK